MSECIQSRLASEICNRSPAGEDEGLNEGFALVFQREAAPPPTRAGLLAQRSHAPPHHPPPPARAGADSDGGQSWRELTCGTCGKRFHGRNSKSNLERHLQIHTGVKPFQCPLCSHRANRKANLKTHIEARHGADAIPAYL
nr:replication initiator 1-like [Penaeus vannamei]